MRSTDVLPAEAESRMNSLFQMEAGVPEEGKTPGRLNIGVGSELHSALSTMSCDRSCLIGVDRTVELVRPSGTDQTTNKPRHTTNTAARSLLTLHSLEGALVLDVEHQMFRHRRH